MTRWHAPSTGGYSATGPIPEGSHIPPKLRASASAPTPAPADAAPEPPEYVTDPGQRGAWRAGFHAASAQVVTTEQIERAAIRAKILPGTLRKALDTLGIEVRDV